ncbi:hypothetical protein BKA56DRAFT_714596, partial [Ilyonectria sp. MPI-CAGE-AT-0026]
LAFDRNNPDHKEPQDQVQIIIRFAQRERQHELHNYNIMLRRLAASNFDSMHLTQIQVTNLILNVLDSDAEFNTIAVLRDEIDRILGQDESAEWTKAKVSQMTRADSVGRETLCLHSLGVRAIFRKVMTSNFKTPDGYYLPKGTLLSFLSQPAHVDAESRRAAEVRPLPVLAPARDRSQPRREGPARDPCVDVARVSTLWPRQARVPSLPHRL